MLHSRWQWASTSPGSRIARPRSRSPRSGWAAATSAAGPTATISPPRAATAPSAIGAPEIGTTQPARQRRPAPGSAAAVGVLRTRARQDLAPLLTIRQACPELADAAPEPPADLRQLLRAEDEEHDHQNDGQLPR